MPTRDKRREAKRRALKKHIPGVRKEVLPPPVWTEPQEGSPRKGTSKIPEGMTPPSRPQKSVSLSRAAYSSSSDEESNEAEDKAIQSALRTLVKNKVELKLSSSSDSSSSSDEDETDEPKSEPEPETRWNRCLARDQLKSR